jgi:hypothetical protein
VIFCNASRKPAGLCVESIMPFLLQVRHDCAELAGFTFSEDRDQKLLQELKTEEKDIRAKVPYYSHNMTFNHHVQCLFFGFTSLL